MILSKMTYSTVLVSSSILLLLQLVVVCAGPVPAAVPEVVPAVCRLRIEGYGNRPGVKAAQLSCTGGTFTAAADPQLRQVLGAGKNPSGVRWAPRLKFCKMEEEVAELPCFFSICDGAVTFINPVVTGMMASDAVKNGETSICISGGTVTLVNGTFLQNTEVRPIRIAGKDTTANISNCRFIANSVTKTERPGGAVFVLDRARATIQSSKFVNNSAEVGGAVAVGGRSSLEVAQGCPAGPGCAADHSLFANNSAKLDGGDISVMESRVAISHAKFRGGSALAGGALSSINGTFILTSSTITNATAKTYGGGLYLFSSSAVLDNMTLSYNSAGDYGGGVMVYKGSLHLQRGTYLTHNRAKTCGGGIVFDDALLSADTGNGSVAARLLGAANNTASFGADTCVSALQITVVRTDSNLDSFVTSLGSEGGLLHVTLNVSGSQGLPADDPVQLTIFDSRNKPISTQRLEGKLVDNLRQVAIKLRQPPGTYRLEFSGADPQVTPAKLQLRIVPCPSGYVTASTGDACSQCVRGYFSFNPSDKECTMCVPNAQCPGGAELYALRGFWSSAPKSQQIHRCINPSACLGGNTTANAYSLSASDFKTAQCAQPYQGNLCGDCKEGYGRARAFLCRKCMPRVAIVLLYTAAALAMIGLIKLLMYFESPDTATRPSLQQPIPSELLKVLVLHGQWLFILANLVGIPWPATLMYPLQVISGIWSSSSGSSLGFECILPRNTAIPVAMGKVLLSLFTPVAIICVVLASEAIMHRLKARSTRGRTSHTKHQFASLVMSVVFLFLPTWVSTTFSLFTCIQLDRPASWPFQAAAVGTWWVEDMSQQCYSAVGYHKRWAIGLGIPLIVLLCVALPGGVFLFMWHSRKQGKLSDPAFERHYGFMYHMWRGEVCWYEAVIVLQTIGLVMVATFGFALGPYFQALVTQAVLGVVVMLLLWVRPYKCPAANAVAVQSACVLLLTSYTALTFLSYNGLEPGAVYGNIMGVVLLLLNVLFLGATIWKLIRSVDWSAIRSALSGITGHCCGVGRLGSGKGRHPPAESRAAVGAAQAGV